MFKFIEKLKDYKARRDNTNLIMRAWKTENNNVYTDFKKRINAIATGDITILEKMYALAKDCTPNEVLDFYDWIAHINKNPAKQLNIRWAGKYATIIAQCMTQKQMWLAVNLKSGEVTLSDYKKPACLTVGYDTPKELWDNLPIDLRCYIVRQVDHLIKDTKMFKAQDKEMLYQSLAFFSRLFVLVHAAFIGEFLANLYDRVIDKKEPLAYCMYYFVVFDHGLTKMAQLIDSIMRKECIEQESMTTLSSCIRMLVGQSVEMGVETKASWEKTAEKSNPEIWKEVAYALRGLPAKRGNKRMVMSLDELISGNKAKIKEGIGLFMADNKNDICLAYLLNALVNAGKVKESTKYMTFHRAIELFTHNTYGHDVPQKRYGEIRELGLKGPQRSASYKRAKLLIDEWTKYFANCG